MASQFETTNQSAKEGFKMYHEYGLSIDEAFSVYIIRAPQKKSSKDTAGTGDKLYSLKFCNTPCSGTVQQESIKLRNSRGLEKKACSIPINILAALIPHAGMSLFTACHFSSFKWFIQCCGSVSMCARRVLIDSERLC